MGYRRLASIATIALAAACGTTNGTSTDRATVAASPPTDVTVKVLWTRTADFFGEPQLSYVARVTNEGSVPASVVLDVQALDASGTIVGSDQPTLPNIAAGETFDFFSGLGGTVYAPLSGEPAEVTITQADNPFGAAGAADVPQLKTSKQNLEPGDPADLFTDAPRAYNLSVTVTNDTPGPITTLVQQQVVLYDDDGNVVGGATGASDNQPQNFKPGASYQEEISGIPATDKAASAEYSVWPA